MTPDPVTVVRGATLSRWPRADEIGDVVVIDGRIAAIGPCLDAPIGASTVDAGGLRLAPGFIDLQINGSHGIDVASSPHRIGALAAVLPAHGVTSFLPTVVSSTAQVVDAAIDAVAEFVTCPGGAERATVLGLHLEGPFLAPARRGAHRPEHLAEVGSVDIERWTRANGVRMVTLAPELPGAVELIGRLVEAGVTVAAGHTDATYEQMTAATDAGLTGVTHLFNAMAGLHHREPGVVGAALDDTRLVAGLIVDGHHLHPAAVRLAFGRLGVERTVLVSDAIAAAGLADGDHMLGDVAVRTTGGVATTTSGVLAGSVVSLDDAVRRLCEFTGCAPAAAIATVTSTPAALLGEPARGRLAVGAVADLVLLDGIADVVATMISGRWWGDTAWSRPARRC